MKVHNIGGQLKDLWFLASQDAEILSWIRNVNFYFWYSNHCSIEHFIAKNSFHLDIQWIMPINMSHYYYFIHTLAYCHNTLKHQFFTICTVANGFNWSVYLLSFYFFSCSPSSRSIYLIPERFENNSGMD